jgi:hypothetical protein
MPNGDTCAHHTDLACDIAKLVQATADGQVRMTSIADSVEKIQISVGAIQATLLRWAGALALLVFLLSIFGDRIARVIFHSAP